MIDVVSWVKMTEYNSHVSTLSFGPPMWREISDAQKSDAGACVILSVCGINLIRGACVILSCVVTSWNVT